MFHEFAPNLVNVHFPILRTSRLEQFTFVAYIRAEPDITRFKNILKTYFFTLAFDLLGYSFSI